MSRTYPLVYSIRFLDQNSPEQWTSRAPTSLTTVERPAGAELIFVREDGTEVRVTEVIDALLSDAVQPSATWYAARFQLLNTFMAVAPTTFGFGWTNRVVVLSITSGALPTGVSLITDPSDPNWSEIRGTPTLVESGEVYISGETALGTFTYYLPWTVNDPLGMSLYTNSINRYPSTFVNTDPYSTYTLERTGMTGSVDGSWVFSDATNYVVYHFILPMPQGARDFLYVFKNTGDGSWYTLASTVPLASLTNGTDFLADFTETGIEVTIGGGNDFTDGGVIFPSCTIQHYVTSQYYINFGQDASLDGFMSRNNSWSCGLICDETIEPDDLGRILFARANSNYVGWKERGTADGYVVYGKDSIRRSDLLDASHGTLTAGQHVGFTFNGGTRQLILYLNGAVINTFTVANNEWETATATDVQDLWFGRSSRSNSIGEQDTRYHAFWQGRIADLWVANGVLFTGVQMLEISGNADVTTSANYGSITHHWPMTETSGTTFTAAKGGVNGTGAIV